VAEQWEYRTLLLAKLDDEELNELGGEGWEAVGIMPSFSHNVIELGPRLTDPHLMGRSHVGQVVDSYLVLFKRRR
jgi:hypothetical protein